MSALKSYFETLLKRVESSDEIANNGKDENGFFKPTRELLVRHLGLLRDLHDKPRARDMVRGSWQFVVQNLPPEWLILTAEQKAELKSILES